MKRLSLVMIVKNESKSLARCLDSVKPLVHEMVVVDTGSTDNTKEIAVSFGAKVSDFNWIEDFSAARNFALQQSSGDWNLILDGDEYISQFSQSEVQKFTDKYMAIGRVRLLDKFYMDGEVSFSQIFISRLIPKGCSYEGNIHEQIVSNLPRVKVPIEIQHDGYFGTNKSDRNIALLKKSLQNEPNNPYYLYQISKEYRGLNHPGRSEEYIDKAYKNLSKSENYAPNLIVDALYVYIANRHYEKAYKMIEAEKAFLADYPDFHFVTGRLYIDLILSDLAKYQHLFFEIEKSYLKCLELGETSKYGSVLGTGSFAAWYNLGTFYETTGQTQKARNCYQEAAQFDYQPAIDRIKIIR